MGFDSIFQHFDYFDPVSVFGSYLGLYTSFHYASCFVGKLRDRATTSMKRAEANSEVLKPKLGLELS